MMLTVPLAAARCSAQAHLWGAIIDLDLATRLARRSGEKGPPASELRSLLTETFVVETVAAKENGELTVLLQQLCLMNHDTHRQNDFCIQPEP